MPVSGYYEWQATADGKQPHYFTARDGSPVLTVAAPVRQGHRLHCKRPAHMTRQFDPKHSPVRFA